MPKKNGFSTFIVVAGIGILLIVVLVTTYTIASQKKMHPEPEPSQTSSFSAQQVTSATKVGKSSPTTAATKTYQRNNFQITLPSDWTTREAPVSGGGQVFIMQPKDTNSASLPSISMTITSITSTKVNAIDQEMKIFGFKKSTMTISQQKWITYEGSIFGRVNEVTYILQKDSLVYKLTANYLFSTAQMGDSLKKVMATVNFI